MASIPSARESQPKPWAPYVYAAALLAVLGGTVAWAAMRTSKPQMVFIKTNEVMARYKGAIQARESFQKQSNAWAEEAKQLDGKLRDLLKTGKITDAKVKEQAVQLRSRIDSLRQKGAQLDQELTAPMLAEVNAGIKRFAQKNGYRLVIGTLNGGVVLYGDDSLDVTEALIADLNH